MAPYRKAVHRRKKKEGKNENMFQKMKKMLSDKTLQELLFAMPMFGLLCQMTVVWFTKDKLGYSIGLWVGIFTAACMAIHMNASLEKAFRYDEATAQKIVVKNNLIRYGFVVVVCFFVMKSGFINPLATFLGLMALKVSAYLQPFTHKLIRR